MKKVKTLLGIFAVMLSTALFGACSCSKSDVSVVGIRIINESNLLENGGEDKYIVNQGDEFTLGYEILPESSSDKQFFVNITPKNIIDTEGNVISYNPKNNTGSVKFKASTTNMGVVTIEFETKDGGHKDSVQIEVAGNLNHFETPSNLKYDKAQSKYVWDESYTVEGGIKAEKYEISINDVKTMVETNSFEATLYPGQINQVKVRALGSLADRTGNSEFCATTRFYKAKAVTNFKFDNGKFTWDYSDINNTNITTDPNNITNFVIDLGSNIKPEISANGTFEFDLALYLQKQNITNINTFNPKIYAINKNFESGYREPSTGIKTYILPSETVSMQVVSKMHAPENVAISVQDNPGTIFTNSVLSWEDVNGADYYDIKIFKGAELISADEGKPGTLLNLSDLLSTAGRYKVEITAKGDPTRTLSGDYSTATKEFVIAPLLKGSVNYTTDELTLNLTELTSALSINSTEINKLDFEIYYSEKSTGNYDKKWTVTGAEKINLATLGGIEVESQYYMLVRPIPNANYNGLDMVVPKVGSIDNNKTVNSMISQLKTVSVETMNNAGIITAIDENPAERVDNYRFELYSVGQTTQVQNIARDNVTFDENETTKFTVSLVEIFGITEARNYTVKIIPTSSSTIDASATKTVEFAFSKLQSVASDSITIEDNKLIWNAVNDRTSYSVTINEQAPVDIIECEYLVDISTLEDSNNITFVVVGNNENNINSDPVTITRGRAPSVTNIHIKDGLLEWNNDVADSEYYVVIELEAGSTLKVDCGNKNFFAGLEQIPNNANITVLRGLQTAFNSVASEKYAVTRIGTPIGDLKLVDNSYKARFTAVDEADIYKVEIRQSNKVIHSIMLYAKGDTPNCTISAGVVEFTLPNLEAGTYSVYLQAVPNDQTSDDYLSNGTFYLISAPMTNPVEIVMYPQVNNISTTGTLTFDFNETKNLQDFVIVFPNSEHADIVLTEKNCDFADLRAGEYTVRISPRAMADTQVIYSAPKEITFTKCATPTLSFSGDAVTFTNVTNVSKYDVYDANNDELLTLDTDYTLSFVEEVGYIRLNTINYGSVYGIYIIPRGAEGIIDGSPSQTVSFTKIASTENIVLSTSGSDKVFTWNAVEGNNGYKVEIVDALDVIVDDISEVVNTESYTLPASYTTWLAGTYTLKITVIGGNEKDGAHLLDSDIATQNFVKLDTISGETKSGETLSFSYSGASSPVKYHISVLTQNDTNWTELKNFEMPSSTTSIELTNIADMDFKLAITALGSDETFTLDSSEKIASFTYNDFSSTAITSEIFSKIASSAFEYANGEMALRSINGATAYEIYTVEDDVYTLLAEDQYTLDATSLKFSPINAGKNYTLAVKVIASDLTGKLNSSYSEKVTINKLSAVNDLTINLPTGDDADNSGTIRWTPITNASGYTLRRIGGSDLDIPGGATSLINFSSVFSDMNLELGVRYELAIMAKGSSVTGEGTVYYINSDMSNSIAVEAVDNINNLKLVSGTLSWDPVAGVDNYLVDLYITGGVEDIQAKCFSVSTTSVNLNSFVELRKDTMLKAKVTPLSVSDDSYYCILDAEINPVELVFERFNCIKQVSIYNGMIKIVIDIQAVTLDELIQISQMESWEDLSEEDQKLLEKYYGYFNFEIAIKNLETETISIQDMYSYDFDVLNNELTYLYELQHEVSHSQSLNLTITSIGNDSRNLDGSYRIGSLPDRANNTIVDVYKYSAPIPTGAANLISAEGEISFRKVLLGDGKTYATKYILNATNPTDNLFYIVEIPSGEEGNASFNIGNVNNLTYSYYQDSVLKAKVLDNNEEYKFTLTTLGTEDASSGDLYLRSNVYETAYITFLYDFSGLSYKYVENSTDGGYLSWISNEQCVKYYMYVVDATRATTYFGENATQVRGNSSWIEDTSETLGVQYFTIGKDETSYMFHETSLPKGEYWCALRPIGNGTNFITSDKASTTVIVKKLNSVSNGKVENGSFTWSIDETERAFIIGYKILITVHNSEGEKVKTITRPQLVRGTQSYALEDQIEVDGVRHTFTGVDAEGNPETYSIAVIAIGGLYNGSNYVCSSKHIIDNAGRGYQRLSGVSISVNTQEKRIDWVSDLDTKYISGYVVYINAEVTDNTVRTTNSFYSFSNLVNPGDYSIRVVALAETANTVDRPEVDIPYLNSLPSDFITLVKFAEPQLAVSNGEIVWFSNENGDNLKPLASTIIISKDGREVMRQDGLEVFTYSLADGVIFPAGEYSVSVKFNDHTEDGVYHIESQLVSMNVFKLATPTIEAVNNFIIEENQEPEIDLDGFVTSMKWLPVTDKSGAEVIRYRVDVYTPAGEGELLLTSEMWTGNDNPLFTRLKDNPYIYFGIDNIVKNYETQINGSISLRLYAIGDSTQLVTSSYAEKLIERNVGIPTNASTQNESNAGIIRWAGSEYPVFIDMMYYPTGSAKSERYKVYLDEKYIEKYGKVYYVPFMGTYEFIDISFVCDNSAVGYNRFTVGVQSHFTVDTTLDKVPGTLENPYIIENVTQLRNIKYRPYAHFNFVENATFDLANNWEIITMFGGVINGNNATINNIRPNNLAIGNGSSRTINASLFSETTADAVISNLNLNYNINVNNSGSAYAQSIYVSGVVANNYGTISNLKIGGNVEASTLRQIYFGAISIHNYGVIENCEILTDYTATLNSNPTVDTQSDSKLYAGGISCYNENFVSGVVMRGSLILNSEGTQARNAGGVSYKNTGLIMNSDYFGKMTSWSMAGIALINEYHDRYEEGQQKPVILGCTSLGNFQLSSYVTSQTIYIGGVVGLNRGGMIGRCHAVIADALNMNGYYTSNEGAPYVGGLVALNNIGGPEKDILPEIENSYSAITSKVQIDAGKGYFGTIVGGYSGNESYGVNWCINNSLCYSPYYSAINNRTLDEEYAQMLGSSSAIVSETYVEKLNTVKSGDTTYDDVRVFAIESQQIILKSTTA